MGARRVVPIHWDDFYRSLDEPLVPTLGFKRAMGFLRARGKQDGVDIRLQTEWTPADPFSGLQR